MKHVFVIYGFSKSSFQMGKFGYFIDETFECDFFSLFFLLAGFFSSHLSRIRLQ